MDNGKGFFSNLFDISFSEFITTRIIKVLYVIAIIISAIAAIGVIISGFADSMAFGIVTVILAPIIFILYVILSRIWLEILIVVFRIAEDVHKLANKE